MTTYFSVRSYVDPLRIGARYAKPVARLLLHAAPSDITPEEQVRLAAANALADEIGGVLYERDRLANTKVQPLSANFRICMGALHDALLATASLPEAESENAGRAKELLRIFFPEGIAFTKLSALAAWSEGEWRMQQIEKNGWSAVVGEITRPEFLSAAKRATEAFGEVIGVGRAPREEAPKRGLQLILAQFSRKVAAYVRALAARVDEDDAASIERFRSAVAPIDEFRARRAAASEEESADEEAAEEIAEEEVAGEEVAEDEPNAPTPDEPPDLRHEATPRPTPASHGAAPDPRAPDLRAPDPRAPDSRAPDPVAPDPVATDPAVSRGGPFGPPL
jgi:hypothetical protein